MAKSRQELYLDVVSLERDALRCSGNCANISRRVEEVEYSCMCCHSNKVLTASETCSRCQADQKQKEADRRDEQARRDLERKEDEARKVERERAVEKKRLDEQRAKDDVNSWINNSVSAAGGVQRAASVRTNWTFPRNNTA